MLKAGPVAIERVEIDLATAVAALSWKDGMRVEVRRGATIFPMKNASVSSAMGKTVELYVTSADPSARAFLDDRVYPWRESIVRVADANENGVLGHHDPKSRGVAMIVPGDPMKSFLLLRLIDETKGDLMPRQCREWTDSATKALGCWIRGLKTDANGTVLNADAPIDYAACDFDPSGKGRCKAIEATGGRPAVEGIVARSCGGTGCHIDEASPAAGLDLSAGKLRASTVSVASSQRDNWARVTPAVPDRSWFLCKLDPACADRRGALMPLGARALSNEELAIVRAWIADGAQ